jgi:transcription-repair coupling factor (superfamily II helicase)
LFGDEIERMRLFDPETQRSLRPIEQCPIHPVRETVPTIPGPLRARVLALADASETPSSKSRQVLENLEAGVDFFGVEALAPVFHAGWCRCGTTCRRTRGGSSTSRRGWSGPRAEALQEYVRAARAPAGGKDLVAPPEQFFVDEDEVGRSSQAAPVVGSRLAITEAEVGEPVPEDSVPKDRSEDAARSRSRATGRSCG